MELTYAVADAQGASVLAGAYAKTDAPTEVEVKSLKFEEYAKTY